jgi:hypothetical protein
VNLYKIIFLNPENNQNNKLLIENQIDATDRQIDTLAYEPYGLTADEMNIVKRKHNTKLR